jgi:hypothetical protein
MSGKNGTDCKIHRTSKAWNNCSYNDVISPLHSHLFNLRIHDTNADSSHAQAHCHPRNHPNANGPRSDPHTDPDHLIAHDRVRAACKFNFIYLPRAHDIAHDHILDHAHAPVHTCDLDQITETEVG